MNLIEFSKVDFSYPGSGKPMPGSVLKGVSFTIADGEYVALLGESACGKSTLLKLCNGLLLPDQGRVRCNGIDSREQARLTEIRRGAGMVFQDPDAQIIGTTLLEDVAFGPENLGLPSQSVRERVEDALRAVSLLELADTPVHLLTRWQKLKLALAGALAMRPECLLVDDAAAELDTAQKNELLSLLRALNGERGIAVLQATGEPDTAASADRILLLRDGRIDLDVTSSRSLAGFRAEEKTASGEQAPPGGAGVAVADGAGGGGWQSCLAARYLPGDSGLHRCDPRTKLAMALLLMAASFTLTTPASLALLFAVTLALGCGCGRPLGHSIRSLRPIFYLAMVTAAVNLASAGGPPLSEDGMLLRHVSRHGLELSVLMVLRLLLMAATASLLCGTTTPTSLADGIEKTLRPLARIGVPVARLSAMLQVSLRLLPMVVEEAEQLLKEHLVRDGQRAGFPQRLAHLPPLLASLFGRLACKAEAMAEAMEARCYPGSQGRSRMTPLCFSKADLAGVTLLAALLLAAAGIEYLLR